MREGEEILSVLVILPEGWLIVDPYSIVISIPCGQNFAHPVHLLLVMVPGYHYYIDGRHLASSVDRSYQTLPAEGEHFGEAIVNILGGAAGGRRAFATLGESIDVEEIVPYRHEDPLYIVEAGGRQEVQEALAQHFQKKF